MFTLTEIKLLIEAIGTLISEHGETPARVAMEVRLREHRDRLVAEIDSGRF